MDLQLKGKTALILGGSKGLGRGVADALAAEGVAVATHSYVLQHKLALYHEAQWWHHTPEIPESLPGSELANRTAIAMRPFTKAVPELVDQYAKAFEKVWAHRAELGKA